MSYESPECMYNSMLQFTSDLVNGLQHCLSVSDKLLEKGLVTEDVHEWILTAQGVSNRDKARRLVSCVTAYIKQSMEKYNIFITVLQRNPYLSDIADMIQAKYESLLRGSDGIASRTSEYGAELQFIPIQTVGVGDKITELERKFSKLQRRTSTELTTNNEVTPEVLLESLTLLPIALRNEYETSILENLETLQRADSVRKVFHHLNPLFTFIDYGLLEHIINEFGSRRLKHDMSKYVETVQIFIDQTTVLELMDHWQGVRDIPPHFEELRAVIDKDPSTYTLRQLDDLRKRFCTVMLLYKTVLILIGIKRRSSFLLSWIIPSVFFPHLKSMIRKLIMNGFFQVEQMYSLSHDGQRLYSMADEYEMRLLTLCDEGTGDENEALYLLSQPEVNPNAYDECGRTSLWHASYQGRLDLVIILLEYGADVNLLTDDEFGDTALIEACDGGHAAIAALLIDKGARVDYKNKLGQHSLYFASFNGDLSIVYLLIQSRANIDLPTDDDYGFTALGIACQEGHIEIAQLLINSGAAVNYRNKVGATPLYIARECGHHDIFQLLLESGTTIDEMSKEDKAALSRASWREHTDIAAVPDKPPERRLVTENIHEQIVPAQSASSKDKAGRVVSNGTDGIKESSTALQLSPIGGSGASDREEVGEVVHILESEFSNLQKKELSINSEVTPEVLPESLTLLPIALRNENEIFIRENLETTVQELMDHWQGVREIPPHFEELRAVIDEDPSLYTLRQLDDLRKRFCSITMLSETVVILTGIKRRSSFLLSWIIPSALLPHLKSVIGKLNVFFQDEQIYSLTHDGQRLYSMADEYEMRLLKLCDEGTGDESEALYLLSQPEVNPNVYDESGRTSLWHASSLGRINFVRILLEYGADVNLPTDDEFGDSALIETCDGGHVAIAALLIDKGAMVDYKNKLGQHSLYFASFNGDLSIVHLLIQHRADIDLPTDDDYGFTALGIACQEGHIDVVRLLVDSGAAVNYRNKLGGTPLYIASECGHHDIFQLLLDSGATIDKLSKDSKMVSSQASRTEHTDTVAVPDKPLEGGVVTEGVHERIVPTQGASNKDNIGRLVSNGIDSIKESATALLVSPTGEAREREEVGETIQILIKEFTNILQRTSSELTANNVTPEELIGSLTLFPLSLQHEYETLICKNSEALERADNVYISNFKFFHHLYPHFTFIEYGLLACIVDDFGSKQLKSDMSGYIEKVQSFIDETTVLALMDHWPGVREVPPHFEELRVEINEDSSMYTLRKLDNLRKKFCDVISLSETVLILIGIKRRSSFLLSWIIPSILLPHLKSVIGKLGSFLQVERIYSLTHDGQRLYSIADEYERKLLALCEKGIGDKNEVLNLLNHPEVNPNAYDECGRSSLWHSTYHKRSDLVGILLEHGADVNLPNDDELGDTAIIEACDRGHVDTATLLIDKGAKIDYKNKFGQHSLYFASYNGNLSIVHLLIEHGAEIDLPTDDDCGFTALGIACQEGHIEIAQLLIDSGAAIDYHNKLGATPLYMASQCGHLGIVQLLLDCGASVDESSKTGWTALLDASDEGHTEVVELLIKHGAQLDIRNREGRTALCLASWRGHADIARLLIEGGADTNICDQEGLTPLKVAMKYNHDDVVKILEN